MSESAQDNKLSINNGADYGAAQKARLRFLHGITRVVAARFNKPRVVEVGAYPGTYARYMERELVLLDAIDIVADSIPEENRRLYRRLISYDLESKLPAEFDGSYDVVLSFAVIEHLVTDPLLYLENCYRLLQPAGRLVIQTPNKSYLIHRIKSVLGMTVDETPLSAFQTKRREGFYGHVLLYNLDELGQMLEHVGFVVEQGQYFNSYNGASVVKRLLVKMFSVIPTWRNQMVLVGRKMP
jgi:SAM-dependent methyltransferase